MNNFIKKKRLVFNYKIGKLEEFIWKSSANLSSELRNMKTKNGIKQPVNNIGIIIRILKSRSATNDSKVETEKRYISIKNLHNFIILIKINILIAKFSQ